MLMELRHLLVVCLWLPFICGDVYFHNPRGSNNRLNEETRPRRNAKRLFDSQNNNRGGYNDGPMYYYAGSTLQVEWTNQHSCANPNSHCELILQYMCADTVRDGTSTTTIPLDQNQCANKNCNTDQKYGMNEDYDYYINCALRKRNKGLFTADQNLFPNNRQKAKNTRQNPNGNRYAYECPEERDYFPYWHPTPWKDIAIMTNNVTMCPYYQQESRNVRSKWACVIPRETIQSNLNKFTIPNNEEDCQKFRYPANDENGVKGKWTEFPAHGIPAPECRETEFTRDNHLGNGLAGRPNVYNWTIPNTIHENCVLRIRYNISTEDYDGWSTTSDKNAEKSNSPTKVDLSEKYSFASKADAADRGYVFENNPNVEVFADADFDLALAINTAQYGRTFQDRSFTFGISKRPSGFENAEIHNLNVRGKRGNIVQVYPAVEYDFVPNTLEIAKDATVHIQWTGSDTNPANNDGNGRAKTDRNNMVQLTPKVYTEGRNLQFGPGEKHGHYGNNYPAHLRNSSFLAFPFDDREKLAILLPGRTELSLTQLDDAEPYYDHGLEKASQIGTYHYMCTRNNDFSNRDQKGRIMVYPYHIEFPSIGWMGGSIQTPNQEATLTVPQGAFSKLQTMRIEQWSVPQGEEKMSAVGANMPYGEEYMSDFILLSPEEILADRKMIQFDIKLHSKGSNIRVYRSRVTELGTWIEVPSEIVDGRASMQVDSGGVYIARSHPSNVPYIGIIIAVVALIVVATAGVVYFRLKPEKWTSLKKAAKYAERSLQDEV